MEQKKGNEEASEAITNEELDDILNYAVSYYHQIGSPPIFFAKGPAPGEAHLLRGHVGGMKYCEIDDNETMESMQRKVYAAILEEGCPQR